MENRPQPSCSNCGHPYKTHAHPPLSRACYRVVFISKETGEPCPCFEYHPEQFDEELPEPGTRPSFDYPYSLDPMYVTDSSGDMTLLTDETGAKSYLQRAETTKSGPRRVWKVRVIPLAEMEVEVRTELKEKE